MPDAIAGVDAGPDLRRIAWPAFLLGFGLAGFFDGILLHQILQWHHLLSNFAPGNTVADLRFLMLADGLFHGASYAVTVLGLWLFWDARASLSVAGALNRIVGFGLVGFGAWHIADAILFHWILQLHRVRMDADNVLLWDILWLILFGLVPAAIGYRLLRQPPSSGDPGRGRPAALALGMAELVAGLVALRPPAGMPSDRTLAIFWPGMDFPAIVAAAEAAGGLPIWSDASGVWRIAFGPNARPAMLYRHGAVMVSNGPIAVGCLSWSEI